MKLQRRTAPVTIARQMRHYNPGDRIRVIQGRMAGMVMTVRGCSSSEVWLMEMLKRDSMSKCNVEPEHGFTDHEMQQAKRVAQKMKGIGSLV